jgi:outer membrane protein assembly factor BamB
LAKPELIQQAPAITSAASLAAWLPEAMKEKPVGVETAGWLRACTIATLGGGAPRELAYPLLEALLNDAAARGLTVDQQLAALDDAALLALDLRDGQSMQMGILTRYVQIGVRAAGELIDGGRPWSLVRSHYHAVPAVTWMQLPTDLSRAIRWELISDAYRQVPDETLDFVARLRFYQPQRDAAVSGLSEWVESLAMRQRPQRGGGEAVGRLKDAWREPLVEELSKEAYNALTELRAVLDSQAWDDAAQLVTSLDRESTSGVAPYVSDRALLTSLPVAVQLTLEDYPQLRQSLGNKFEALARLRIAQAINVGNAATIELATVQFAGTPAAADAHRWLGDQALVAGHFARAVTQYERARAAAPAASSEISPRIRLAAAMLGRDAEEPVTKTVRFGDVSMSPAQFEALVAEMRARETSSPAASQSGTPPPVSPPSHFKSHVRSRLDGAVGERPQEEVGRRTNSLRVPWADRQIATTVAGDVMYVSNHFQVAAYKLSTGERLWQSQAPPGQPQRAQEFAMIPMRPLVAGERIFVRLLYSPNPQLVCIDRSSGKLLWTAESHDREFLVSDPVLIEGQLVALSIAIQPDQQGLLRHCTLDPQTGELLRQRDLVQLRNTWGTRACCELVELEDGLAAVLGGVSLATDAVGQLRWVRTHISLPAEEDPRWVMQTYQKPLLNDGRLYVAQPGVRSVDCLAAATGRRFWSAVLPEVVGVVGRAGDKLIVRTESDVRGLDLASGQTQWRYAADNVYTFQLTDDQRLLIASREPAPDEADRWRVRLTWLHPSDGKPAATTALAALAESDPRLGPLVPYKDRVFTFFGRGQHDPTRDLIELVPAGEAEPAPTNADAWHARLQAAPR